MENLSDTRKKIRAYIFLAGPFFVFLYALLPISSLLSYSTIFIGLCWIYLSIEDSLHHSVPVWSLIGSCALTCTLAICFQRSLEEYVWTGLILGLILTIVLILQFLKKYRSMGSADFFAIFSLGMTLTPSLLGPWLMISCLIPLVGLIGRSQVWSSKLPFIPYLTVGWLIISAFNVSQ